MCPAGWRASFKRGCLRHPQCPGSSLPKPPGAQACKGDQHDPDLHSHLHQPQVLEVSDGENVIAAAVQRTDADRLPALLCLPFACCQCCRCWLPCPRLCLLLDQLVDCTCLKMRRLAVQNDTPSVVGSGLDELLRHVRTLKPDGVQLIITILHRLCKLGGELVEAAGSCVSLCMPLCFPGGYWRPSTRHCRLLHSRA